MLARGLAPRRTLNSFPACTPRQQRLLPLPPASQLARLLMHPRAPGCSECTSPPASETCRACTTPPASYRAAGSRGWTGSAGWAGWRPTTPAACRSAGCAAGACGAEVAARAAAAGSHGAAQRGQATRQKQRHVISSTASAGGNRNASALGPGVPRRRELTGRPAAARAPAPAGPPSSCCSAWSAGTCGGTRPPRSMPWESCLQAQAGPRTSGMQTSSSSSVQEEDWQQRQHPAALTGLPPLPSPCQPAPIAAALPAQRTRELVLLQDERKQVLERGGRPKLRRQQAAQLLLLQIERLHGPAGNRCGRRQQAATCSGRGA